ncbi:MAG: DNA mismatch repair endonuclease MutL, partial [Anaerolineae bacterium]|nr:DNA mismatch repair endonuclease MutL [Anaerolineae bacterium]
MPIHVLPDEVASQIAAGEVVERPASVVKELMENALDAGAQHIGVRTADAGRRLIEVTDDGMGIPLDEIVLAVARHATSKLLSAEDLFQIRTLGFRGEALASIASVSRFTLTSRTSSNPMGGRLTVEAGRMHPVEPVGVPVGTQVRVEDLFYNVPARLKFLKRDITERQQMDGLVTRYALAYAHVRFHLQHDDRPSLQTSGNGDRREVLANLYGVEIARQMLEVVSSDAGIRVNGFISPVALTRSNRREITFFVNGRWVQDASLSAALLQAYHTLLMVGRYPLAALFVEVPPEEVDVNVHPAKAEVRFRSPDVIFSAVSRAVRRALLAYSPVPSAAPSATWQRPLAGSAGSPEVWSGETRRVIDPAWGMSREILPVVPADMLAVEDETGELPPSAPLGTPDAPGQADLPGGGMPILRLVGQVGATYLVAEGPDGLYLIDQHAAHERVLFERFMRTHDLRPASQSMLEPVLVTLPPAQAVLLSSQVELLGHFGF